MNGRVCISHLKMPEAGSFSLPALDVSLRGLAPSVLFGGLDIFLKVLGRMVGALYLIVWMSFVLVLFDSFK